MLFVVAVAVDSMIIVISLLIAINSIGFRKPLNGKRAKKERGRKVERQREKPNTVSITTSLKG